MANWIGTLEKGWRVRDDWLTWRVFFTSDISGTRKATGGAYKSSRALIGAILSVTNNFFWGEIRAMRSSSSKMATQKEVES